MNNTSEPIIYRRSWGIQLLSFFGCLFVSVLFFAFLHKNPRYGVPDIAGIVMFGIMLMGIMFLFRGIINLIKGESIVLDGNMIKLLKHGKLITEIDICSIQKDDWYYINKPQETIPGITSLIGIARGGLYLKTTIEDKDGKFSIEDFKLSDILTYLNKINRNNTPISALAIKEKKTAWPLFSGTYFLTIKDGEVSNFSQLKSSEAQIVIHVSSNGETFLEKIGDIKVKYNDEEIELGKKVLIKHSFTAGGFLSKINFLIINYFK